MRICSRPAPHPHLAPAIGRTLLAALLANIVAANGRAAQVDVAANRADVVVTATRSAQSSFDLPAAIDTLSTQQLRDGQMQVNLSEALVQVPGIVAHNRQNYAQDLQISARGFGARSTFGVRGVRIYVDGIPATMPDGQGQLSHIDLGSAARVEVLRGPFSALYGNSSGGVISVFSEDGKAGERIGADFGIGSYGTQRQALKFSGAHDQYNYVAAVSNFDTDGYREHSAVRRANFNSKLGIALDDVSQLTLVANAVDMPEAQDALGLTRAQFERDPRQAGLNAETYNTRKSVRQQQLGANYQRQLGADDSLAIIIYGGRRSSMQFQALPSGAQNSPASAGGVIDLQRNYWGSDWHWTHRGSWLGGPTEFSAGFSYDALSEARRGYQNFMGSSFGVMGQLRRDENNRVYNFDQYAQWQWEPADSWLLIAGLRNSRVPVKSRDHYVVPGNGDDSGGTEYNATTPVLGITYRFSDALHFYADYGKGFETPTLVELAYKSTSGANTGLNLGLNPSRSEHYEIGAKARFAEIYSANIAAFHVVTHDELSVAANSSGRSVYQNVGKTQRDGIEASFDGRWRNGIGLALAYTLLRAKYVEDFISCPGSPCSSPQIVSGGNRIPGVPVSALFGELSWRHQPSGFDTALEVHREAKLYVNDSNSDAAPAYTALNWRAGFKQQLQQWRLQEFIRVDNLFDRKYAGSVIVNESSSRYFEPAPGRNIFAGVRAEFDW